MSKIIVIACSKGGAGKTTTSFLLGAELAYQGLPVTIIDADPNHPIASWQDRGGSAKNLNIIRNESEENILDNIERAAEEAAFVIVDLEGVANMTTAYAISRADLVIIPSQRSALDTGEAAKTINLVKTQAKVVSRQIPYAMLITRTNAAIRSKGMRRMYQSLDANHIDTYLTELNEREAFKAVFDHNKTLKQLSDKEVSGLDKAQMNAGAFAVETITRIKTIANKTQAAHRAGEVVA